MLKTLAARLEIEWPKTWVEWTTTRGHKERKQVFAALREEIPDLVVMSLRDRDDEPAETVGADLVDGSRGEAGFHPRRWRRRYLESYLIWPAAISAATGLPEAQVREQLGDHHAIAITPSFRDTDPPQALLDVRAKEIFREFDVSPVDVAAHMDSTSIPDDIKTFINELAALG